jgi:hypothetical protein
MDNKKWSAINPFVLSLSKDERIYFFCGGLKLIARSIPHGAACIFQAASGRTAHIQVEYGLEINITHQPG